MGPIPYTLQHLGIVHVLCPAEKAWDGNQQSNGPEPSTGQSIVAHVEEGCVEIGPTYLDELLAADGTDAEQGTDADTDAEHGCHVAQAGTGIEERLALHHTCQHNMGKEMIS